MTATYTHVDLEGWLFFTCGTAGVPGHYPDTTQGDAIAVAVEFDFNARTGLSIVKANQKHIRLCSWIAELEMRKWAAQRFFNAASHSNGGGSVSFSPTPLSFTWAQFNDLLAEIKAGSTTQTKTVTMVDAYGGDELPNY
jgi:hypothetical protein